MRVSELRFPGCLHGAALDDGLAIPHRFRGIDASLPWAPLVVLFGRNDAGKTNILAALTSLFDTDRSAAEDESAASFTLTFDDALADESDDARFLAELIQFEDARFNFDPPGLPQGGTIERMLQVPDGTGSNCRFGLGTDVQQLSVIRERIKGKLLAHAAQLNHDWASVVRPFEALIDECLVFRAVIGHSRNTLLTFSVPLPSRDELSPVAVAAAADLSERRSGWRKGRVPFLEPLLVTTTAEIASIFFEIGSIGGGFAPYRVVQLDATPSDSTEFDATVSAAILDDSFDILIDGLASELPAFAAQFSSSDWWFDRDDDWVRVSPLATALCTEISERATLLSPPFIREQYVIAVVPLLPDQLPDEKRVVVVVGRLESPEDALEVFDMTQVSSGIGLWAALQRRGNGPSDVQ